MRRSSFALHSLFTFTCSALLVGYGTSAEALVISQVYGGGGNSGASYANDFIELFNRTTTDIDVTGWSVQYASAGGNFNAATTLSGVIPAGGYYLVAEAAGTGGTTDLPTPDATGSLAMGGTSGKVLLMQSSGAAGVPCPTGPARCGSRTSPSAAGKAPPRWGWCVTT